MVGFCGVDGVLLGMAATVRCALQSAKKHGGIRMLYVPEDDVAEAEQVATELGGTIRVRGLEKVGDLLAMEDEDEEGFGGLWEAGSG